MKALSGRQPWWWAILHAGKRIENRVWPTKHRGPILLHAAAGCTRNERSEAVHWMLSAGVVARPEDVPELGTERMQLGGIIGRARIVGLIEPHSSWGAIKLSYPGVDPRWHMGDQWGFVLTDVEPLPFVACKGRLGLWKADYEALARAGKPVDVEGAPV